MPSNRSLHRLALALSLASLPACGGEQDPTGAERTESGATASTPRIDLVPPRAEFAEPDDPPPSNRINIEIDQSGRVLHEGKTVFDPATGSVEQNEVVALLKELAGQDGRDVESLDLAGQPIRIVNDPLQIRADKHTPWSSVSAILWACAKPDIAIWKLELGVSETGTHADPAPAKIPAYLPRDAEASPVEREPVERLTIRIECEVVGERVPRQEGSDAFDYEGRQLRWTMGARRFAKLQELKHALAEHVNDPANVELLRQGDSEYPLASEKAVLVEPGPLCTFEDTVQVVDALHAAGVARIQYGGGFERSSDSSGRGRGR